MNTSNITNYKPKDFAELSGVSVKMFVNNESLSPNEELVQNIIPILHVFSCRLYSLRKYKKQIKEDGEFAKELQNGNQPNSGTNTENQ